MPIFQYTAKRGPHDVVEGQLEAENRRLVLSYLTDRGYTPVRITEQDIAATVQSTPRALSRRDGKVPARALHVFTRQFASLIHSQVPLLRTLGILIEQTPHPHLRRILHSIADEIRQGETLSGALGKHRKLFSPLYLSLVRAGEIGGMLDTVLERLAAQAERDAVLRARIQTALAYPLFVGVAGIGTVIFLMAFVMPRLLKLFERFGGHLPLPTRLLLAVSHVMSQWWFWGAVLGVVIVLVVLWRIGGSGVGVGVDRVTI